MKEPTAAHGGKAGALSYDGMLFQVNLQRICLLGSPVFSHHQAPSSVLQTVDAPFTPV